MKNKPSTEERIWAVLAHLSALTMGIGLPLPVLGWSQSRRKSNYASFQSLQALGYQTLGYTIWILTTLVVLIVGILGFLFSTRTMDTLETDINAWVIGHSALMFGLMALYFSLPVIAAVACAFGMDFRYPFMGNRLGRYLGYNTARTNEEQTWLNEQHEDRWVASMGHFAVIIVFWGLLASIFTWVMQGKRSRFLKFQSLQTVVYQVGTLFLYFMAGGFYVFGFVVFALTIGFAGTVSFDSFGGLIGAVAFLVSLLVAMLIILAIPIIHILGQWAGYRVLKGDMYRYPLVGKLVQRWAPDTVPHSVSE